MSNRLAGFRASQARFSRIGRVAGPALLALLAAAFAATPVSSAPATPPNVDPQALDDVRDQGSATFWVLLRDKADLAPAKGIAGHKARGEFVVDKLKGTADRSQKGLKSLINSRGAKYRSFYIVNSLAVTGDEALLRQLAAQPEVKEIVADTDYLVPDPQPAEEPKIDAIEWNVDRIRAPLVWSSFSDRGEGIVIANIDTGVQFNHPALVGQYRGNAGGGSFDHNYNWFDPSAVCGNPSTTPCDNNSHGTHTMGTMVGDDGTPGQNQIGVAPGARWIAAKGCEESSCSRTALLASGQWILAPTDLNGQNPRADLRPDVVNNSWGGGGGDAFYQATVDAWVASGIYPQFSNGNGGPECQSSGAPGEYVSSYSAGAYDINDVIASFSSRGPSVFGDPNETKPNLSAPGVSVRSAVPTNGYASKSGTSMASPHVAGTVALMWSAAPSLVNDVAATRTILDDTAVDTEDLSCGGTPDDNNVWGEGKLDAFAAVDQAPRGPTGILSGTVTESETGNPVAGARVLISGQIERTAVTGTSGQYSIRLSVGTYNVRASAFGRLAQTVTGVDITQGSTVTRNFALAPAPSHSVSGHVLDPGGNAVQNATISIVGTSIPSRATDANGFYSFPSVPDGEYDIRAEGGRCTGIQTQRLVVDSNENLNFLLSRRTDSAGYFCETPAPGYVEADTVLPLSGDDTSVQVNLPFPFTFYGQTHQTTWVSTNGHVNFTGSSSSYSNGAIPSTFAPNGSVYALWDDLFVDSSASVRTKTVGTAPSRRFVIEWRNVRFYGDDGTRRMDFEIILLENGRIQTEYRNISSDIRERGGSATIGIENQNGTAGFQYSLNEAVLGSTYSILYRLPPSGFVQGRVTDANDNQALPGTRVRAIQSNITIRETTTDSAGNYRLNLPLGTYTIEASRTGYGTGTASAQVQQQDEVLTRDFSLQTPRAEASPSSYSLIVPRNETRTRTLTLRNTGSLSMNWQVLERVGPVFQNVPWLAESPTGGAIAAGGAQDVTVTIDATGLAPGTYSAVLALQTNSGRQANIDVPVSIVVPAYYQAVNAGGGQYVEPSGDVWAADRAYSVSGWGYTTTKSKPVTVTNDIAGTTDDALYRAQRRDPAEYRFDGLPAGTYEIDLRFAELDVNEPNKRLFDVIIENELKLPAHDIYADAGRFAADDHVFFMPVTDGQLNIRFAPRRYGWPVVNSIKVRHRPDR